MAPTAVLAVVALLAAVAILAVARLDRLLGLAAAAGGGVLAGLLVGGGRPSLAADLAALAVWALGAGAWRLGVGWAAAAGCPHARARALGAAPLLPWLAAWPLAALLLLNPLARAQLIAARLAIGWYLFGWLLAGLGALALWVRVTSPASGRGPTGPEAARAGGKGPPLGTGLAGWWLALPLLALAAAAYWNGAVLDPLQFRGFPDYMTQMRGARRLLAGLLPYDPSIRVWTDVNLPPLTLLVLFAPFASFSESGGKLAYFFTNHAAFFAGLAVLLRVARPAKNAAGGPPPPPLLWSSVIAAISLTFEPWHDSLRLGQQNGIVFCCLAFAAAALLRERDALAGVALAAALIGKPSAALLGLYFLFARRWQAAAAAAVTALLAFAVTLPWTGAESWRFYLFEKAPHILAGTPQQSNVALLALHARLFLPAHALSSFDAMPVLPAAQAMTWVAQLLGVLALWRLTRARRGRQDRLGVHLEFSVALVLSLSLVGHAWQSYVTWLIVAFVPLGDPSAWADVPAGVRRWTIGIAAAGYAALALDDVSLYKVIGNTSAAAEVAASLPNVALLALAFALALLLAAHDTASSAQPVLLAHEARGGAARGR